MGCGSWSESSYRDYSKSVGRTVRTTVDSLTGAETVSLDDSHTAQSLFSNRRLDKALNPKNVMRECCDSEEHPTTVPVILALDVTGSMGSVAAEVAKRLNPIMTSLFAKVPHVEFMVMGIGDLAYDDAPIQISQFESDIRIAEQLDKIYFEGGGGGNSFESYTAAWYMGSRHTKLDCWNRGAKGIIITLGDEPLNPYLPKYPLSLVTGDSLQADVETPALYEEAKEKFDIYHLAVSDRGTSYKWHANGIADTFSKILDEDHFKVVNLDSLDSTIVDIVANAAGEPVATATPDSGISW